MRHSIPARSVVKILDAAGRRNVSAPAAIAAAGIEMAALSDPDARLPFVQIIRLYDACVRLSGDDGFGLHVGEASHPAMFGVLGYLLMNSPTVHEALRRLERYQQVWSDASSFRASVTGGHAQLEYTYAITDPGPAGRRQECEASLAIVTSGLRALVDPAWQPLRVSMQHDRPADVGEHTRIFRCAIEFGQPSNALTFDAAVLASEIPRADPALSELLDRHAQALLAAPATDDGLVGRVRTLIVPALRGGDPDLASVARELGLSPRTLQRRLQEAGTSLHALVDEVRRELAVRYLRQPDITIADVAYLLGFAEPSTFHRAFRKWTGTTPGHFKRRQQDAP